jgi:drug/metabolite transporter (DMT)-like permease
MQALLPGLLLTACGIGLMIAGSWPEAGEEGGHFGQLIVSETLFALLYSFLWDGRWPQASEWAAALLFVLGILASVKAHR